MAVADSQITSKSKKRKPFPYAQEILHHSLQNSHLIVFSIDKEGNIGYCNEGAAINLKKTSQTLLEENIFSIFEFDLDRETFLSRYNDNQSFEARTAKPSWPKLTVRFDTVYHQDSNNDYTGITLIGENITEKQSVAKALARTNAQLKEIFDNANDLIMVFTALGDLKFINEAWKNRLGYDEEDVKTLKLKDVIHPDVLKKTGETLRKIEQRQPINRFETVLLSKYGKKIYVTGNINCTTQKNEPTEFRAVLFDITERIRAERAQSLYYKIANLTIRSANLEILYSKVYQVLSEVLGVKNMVVTLKLQKNELEFPYQRNEYNEDVDIEAQEKIAHLLAHYTFERKKPLIIYDDGIRKIAETKKVDIKGVIPKIWMGVLIQSENKDIGVISIYSYDQRQSYNFKDLELLDFIASQVSLAIERKWNETKIKSQGARIKAIFESSTHQIWSLDKDLRFTSFNQNYADALRQYYDVMPKLGVKLEDLPLKNFKTKNKRLWKQRYQRTMAGEIINFQTAIIDLNGKKIWRDVYLNPIYLPDGSIEEISAISHDITEKKVADEALQESEEKFRNIFESFQDIYFRCDMKGTITMVSPSVEELLGVKPKNVIGHPINKFFESDIYNAQLLRKLLKSKKIRNFDAKSKSIQGEEIRFLCNVRLIEKRGKPVALEGVARDVTQLKEANEELLKAKELAERSLKIKERFLANMSHEIRTPMNGIIGMIDLIASTRLNKEQLEYIKTIKKSSETLLNILNDILDLSKIEAGKMQLRKSPVSLSKMIEKLYELYSQQAHINNTSLYYHVDKNIPALLMVDETRLLQVLSNLTNNAIKFSDGKGNINISLRVIDQKNSQFKIKAEVKDAGIGISKENIERLFNSFSQIDNSQSKTYGGTGLGLAISKELVKSMGGKIGVVSTPGLGSTFWFTFSCAEPDSETLKQLQTTEEPSLSRQFLKKQPVILLVDDNAINRKVASQILAKSGCKVDNAENGAEAIKKAAEKSYDLIFMDIQMPGMDGVQAANEIKKALKSETPPIVAMTAYSMEEDRSKFLNQGMDDYLAKPIKAITLVDKVKDWIHFEPKTVKSDVLAEVSEDLIINQNTLNQLFKYGGEELIQSVLEEFDEETESLLKEAEKAIQTKNYEIVRSNLHTVKGNAGTFGVEKLAKCATNLEKKLKEKNYKFVERNFKDITSCFEEFKANYKNIITKQ